MKDKDRTELISQIKVICDAIGDAISAQDTNYIVLYQNQAHKDIIGDHVGEYCYKGFAKKINTCEGCPLVMTFNDAKIHKSERTVSTDNGTLYVDITASPLKDSTGNVIAGLEIVRDITGRKMMEKELINKMEELIKYYKISGMNYKIEGIAEELKHLKNKLSGNT